jgi:hypothetical protein
MRYSRETNLLAECSNILHFPERLFESPLRASLRPFQRKGERSRVVCYQPIVALRQGGRNPLTFPPRANQTFCPATAPPAPDIYKQSNWGETTWMHME